MSQTDGIIAVSDVEVEGDAPHDDEPHVDLHQLPADSAAGSHHGVGVLHHHHLPVAREDVPGRELLVGGAALCVGLHVQECEHAPVVEADDAPDPGPGPVPGGGLDVLDPGLVEGEAGLHQPGLPQSEQE